MGIVVDRKNIIPLIKDLKRQGQKIVTTNGCFDILHVGHLRYLKKAKSFGDILVVALNSDSSTKALKGDSRPINNENERAELLSNLNCVDIVVIFDEISPEKLLVEIAPDIHTKGADYTIETLPEAKAIIEAGGKIEFIDFIEGKSTTNVIAKINKK